MHSLKRESNEDCRRASFADYLCDGRRDLYRLEWIMRTQGNDFFRSEMVSVAISPSKTRAKHQQRLSNRLSTSRPQRGFERAYRRDFVDAFFITSFLFLMLDECENTIETATKAVLLCFSLLAWCWIHSSR